MPYFQRIYNLIYLSKFIMTSEVHSQNPEQSSKLQTIFKLKYPPKKLSFNTASNNRFKKK
jgi:hypothetical protein